MVIFHARRDLGRGSSGDGALETEIGWNISLITMLAQLYSLAVPRKFVEREGFNFSIVCGVWALHCYIFYSRCKDNWGPSITDEGIIRPQEWDIIVKACYPPGDVGGLLGRDHYLLNICAMIGSLGASIVVIGRVVYLVIESVDTTVLIEPVDTTVLIEPVNTTVLIEPVNTTVLTGAISKWLRISDVPQAWMGLRRVVCLVLFPLITGTQFFAIIQIRRRQRRLAMHIGAEFVDDQWGFGQVVAVVVWVLVLIDYGYAYIFGK